MQFLEDYQFGALAGAGTDAGDALGDVGGTVGGAGLLDDSDFQLRHGFGFLPDDPTGVVHGNTVK